MIQKVGRKFSNRVVFAITGHFGKCRVQPLECSVYRDDQNAGARFNNDARKPVQKPRIGRCSRIFANPCQQAVALSVVDKFPRSAPAMFHLGRCWQLSPDLVCRQFGSQPGQHLLRTGPPDQGGKF